MAKIVRTPSKVAGGITAEEKRLMDEHAKLWIARALRTDPIEPDKIVPAIKGIYAAAGLKEPRVVIVPSPLVMAFAYGAAAAIWYQGNGKKTAPRALDSATHAATRAATDAATHAATGDVERSAAQACRELAGDFGLQCAQRWYGPYQGGNMWAGYDAYLTAFRDVLGLRLKEHAAYAHWEQAAIHGGFRVMHPEFCMVSDFPEALKIDAENRPHCETGPSHRWRDGWSLYHWHGVRIPAAWIEDRASLTAKKALTWPNIEQRRAACEIIGWHHILRQLNAKTIEKDKDPRIGELVEVSIEGRRERFIKVLCGTNREFALPVPPDTKTAAEGNAWTYDVPVSLLKLIEIRT